MLHSIFPKGEQRARRRQVTTRVAGSLDSVVEGTSAGQVVVARTRVTARTRKCGLVPFPRPPVTTRSQMLRKTLDASMTLMFCHLPSLVAQGHCRGWKRAFRLTIRATQLGPNKGVRRWRTCSCCSPDFRLRISLGHSLSFEHAHAARLCMSIHADLKYDTLPYASRYADLRKGTVDVCSLSVCCLPFP